MICMKSVVKHFPADPKIYENKVTFLTDKKVDAELYALLMQHSIGQEGETRVYKSDLPKQIDICQKLGIKSKTTLRSHIKYLLEQGYIIDFESYYRINTRKEDIFFQVDIDTIRFLNDTVKEAVWKTYLYLGQRWNWKRQDFIFSLEDVAKHIGRKIDNNGIVYKELNNILQCLENNGLIKVVTFYEGVIPKKRLVNFSFHHKVNN